MACGLFNRTLLACQNIELFEEATDALITISHKYESRDEQLCLRILTHIVSLRPIWNLQLSKLPPSSNSSSSSSSFLNAIDPSDLDICRAFTRLFTDVAEAFIDYLTSLTVDAHLQSELLLQLIDCVKFPHSNEIARIPLKVFYDLSLVSSHSENIDELCTRFAPIYASLVYVSVHQMLLPMAVLTGKEEIGEDKKADRLDWRESVGDCREVLGQHSTLQLVVSYAIIYNLFL